MKIAILTDESRSQYLPGKEGLNEDIQKRRTIKELKEVIGRRFDCISLKADNNILLKLRKEEVDLVFNMCNGIRGETRLAQIPALLEFAGIPYTGSSTLGHALAIHKDYACRMFKEFAVPTPQFITIEKIEELNKVKSKNIKFPVLVKPCDEGSGRGIHQDSLVYDMDSLAEKVAEELKIYNPPIMITEYIKGREFTVGIVGNGAKSKVLPILEIDLKELPDKLAKFYSFEVKSYYGEQTVYRCPAPLSKDLQVRIENVAKKAYKALKMRDYARVDIRLKKDIPYVLEINSLPGMQNKYSDITKMANACDLGYEGLVYKIIDNAVIRYKHAHKKIKVG